MIGLLPLQGVRVIDLTRVLAGPFAAMLLGDAGADVIKVEPPGGDDTRQWGPPWAGDQSAYYLSVNRNKRSIAVDLAQAEGRQILRRLIGQADVVLENFKVGTMERWGLGYEEVLSPENPGLVYASITGYGRTGPYAGLPGYDTVIEAMGGLMSVTGEPNGPPMKVGVAMVDIVTGALTAFGTVAALQGRALTGRGQRVDLSLLESNLAALANQAAYYLVSGQVPPRYGNGHPTIVPYQVFPTADQPLMVAIGNDRQFERFCRMLDRADLAADSRYRTNPCRVAHRAELVAQLERALGARPAAEWLERAVAAGLPLAPINDMAQVFADPQVLARRMVAEVDHPTAGKVRMVAPPVHYGGEPGDIRRHPPLLGEHTDEVLAQCGLSAREMADLRRAGVVR